MLDLADLVFEDSDPDVRRAPAPAPSDAHVSPLRPWGMWGGWTAVGIACAGAVAHVVSRMGRSVASGRTA
jgi:hypothetical protein